LRRGGGGNGGSPVGVSHAVAVMPHDILVAVDDEPAAARAAALLAGDGHSVTTSVNVNAAIEAARDQPYSLIVLRTAQGSRAACGELRAAGVVSPLLVISPAKGAETRAAILDAGADACLAEPVDWEEFPATVRALLRRSLHAAFLPVRIGSLRIDPLRESASINGKPVHFSAKEFQLLRYLLANKGKILSRDRLLEDVWGYRATTTRTVDMHIAHIRQKLGLDSRRPKLILTIRGEGYVLKADDLVKMLQETV